ncbi:MAG: YARHG domain-containing protein [Eggerthellaceae bacterium]|nr:YARHG domain-containing protein [Eggerthellaceae bacterium]
MSICKELFAKRSVLLTTLAIMVFSILFLVQAPAYAAVGGSGGTGLTVGTADTVVVDPGRGNDAINTTGKSNIYNVYSFGWVEGYNNNYAKSTVKNLDVNGNGWADTIKVVGTRTSSTSGYLKKLAVSVNDKSVFTYTNTTKKINRAVVSVITLKNKQPFLWIDILDGRGNAIQYLYQYKGGKFKKVLSNKDVVKAKTSNQLISSISPNGNTVNVTFNLNTTVTGNTKLKYSYSWKGGTLKRTSNTANKVSYVTKENGDYTNSKLTAAGTFKVYKNTSLNTVKYTVKEGKKVQILSALLSGNKLLYKVKYNGKTGWISCPNIKRDSSKSPYTLFREVYGKVALNTDIPAYTSKTMYSATRLQRYNDHALYVARNEICARHGYVFSNGELANRFKNKSWYHKYRTPMNEVESYNLNLIYNIERARGSLYAAPTL